MGMMYVLLYLVKKYLYSFDKKGTSNSKIKVISTQTILPKKFVSLIKLNNTVYLLGISDQSVNLIDKIDEQIASFLRYPYRKDICIQFYRLI